MKNIVCSCRMASSWSWNLDSFSGMTAIITVIFSTASTDKRTWNKRVYQLPLTNRWAGLFHPGKCYAKSHGVL